MEKMIFIAVCAVCGAAVVIAQAMRTGGRGNHKNASNGAGGAAGGSTPLYMGSKPDLQSQLEESKQRLRDSNDKS